MKKITITFLLVLALMLGSFWASSTYAQAAQTSSASKPVDYSKLMPSSPPSLPAPTSSNSPVLLAAVNIQNAKVSSQNGSDIKVDFDINNQGQVQPQVKYGIRIIQDQKIGDEKVYDEELSLDANQTIHREIDYIAPSFFNGKFEVWVISQNEEGLSLGLSPAGEINLNGSGQFLEVNDSSANLTVGQDAKTYTTQQGVDIARDEKLTAHYQITNHFQNDVQFKPVFETYYRSTFGKLVSETKGNSNLALSVGETKTFNFDVPVAGDPQAYLVKLSLVDQNGKAISNSEYFHYVLQGASATIQNIRLDKDHYQAGDTINESFNWSGSADAFSGSRGGGSQYNSVIIELAVQDGKGTMCVDPISQEIKVAEAPNTMTFQMKATRDCLNPQAMATIKDSNGNVLAQSDFKISSQAKQAAVSANSLTLVKKNQWKLILILSIGVLFLISLGIIGFAYYQKKKNSSVLMKSLLFLIICSSFLLFSNRPAKANTWTIATDGAFSSVAYDINFNTPSVPAGGTISVSTDIHETACSNGTPPLTFSNLYWAINGFSGWNLVQSDSNVGMGYWNGTTAYLTAPSAINTYNIIYSTTLQSFYPSIHYCGNPPDPVCINNCGSFSCENSNIENPVSFQAPFSDSFSTYCDSSSCAPTQDPATVCSGTPVTQTSFCGYASCSSVSGTKDCCVDTGWTPDPSTVCVGQQFTQASINCKNPLHTQTAAGTEPPTNGSCDSTATSKVWEQAPAISDTLCGSGMAAQNINSFGDSYNWTCPGLCNGNSASCSAVRDMNFKETAP